MESAQSPVSVFFHWRRGVFLVGVLKKPSLPAGHFLSSWANGLGAKQAVWCLGQAARRGGETFEASVGLGSGLRAVPQRRPSAGGGGGRLRADLQGPLRGAAHGKLQAGQESKGLLR